MLTKVNQELVTEQFRKLYTVNIKNWYWVGMFSSFFMEGILCTVKFSGNYMKNVMSEIQIDRILNSYATLQPNSYFSSRNLFGHKSW